MEGKTSAWERRKLYWKNVTSKPTNKPTTQQPVTAPKENLSGATKPGALTKNDAHPKIVSRPTQTRATSGSLPAKTVAPSRRPAQKPTVRGPQAIASTSGAILPKKHKLSVSEEPPNKKFKAPPIPKNRRVTVASTRTSAVRPVVQRHRLTDVLPNKKPEPSKTPIQQSSAIRHKRNYHEVPSRIQTGLKRRTTQQISKPPLTKQAEVTPKPALVRQGTFELPDTPAPAPSGTASAADKSPPRSVRRGSYTVTAATPVEGLTSTASAELPKTVGDTEKTSKDLKEIRRGTPRPSAMQKNKKNGTPAVGKEEKENQVPALHTPLAAPTTKRSSKSVSFCVPAGSSRASVTLPKTPRRELSLRQKLESFLDDKGYSVSRHRHLRCFGMDLSQVKQKDKDQATPCRQEDTSSPTLRGRENRSKSLSTFRQAVDCNAEKIAAILSDLKTLLLKGQPLEDGGEWLRLLEEHAPTNLRSMALYWVVKALLEEQAGRYHKALAIFEEAVDKKIEPVDELSQALSEFMERVTEAENVDPLPGPAEVAAPAVQEEKVEEFAEEACQRSVRKSTRKQKAASEKKGVKLVTPNARRSKKDFKEIYESTVIKYTMQASVVQTLEGLLAEGSTPKVMAVLTPVRRSVRLSRSAARRQRTSLSLTDLPRSLQEKIVQR